MKKVSKKFEKNSKKKLQRIKIFQPPENSTPAKFPEKLNNLKISEKFKKIFLWKKFNNRKKFPPPENSTPAQISYIKIFFYLYVFISYNKVLSKCCYQAISHNRNFQSHIFCVHVDSDQHRPHHRTRLTLFSCVWD